VEFDANSRRAVRTGRSASPQVPELEGLVTDNRYLVTGGLGYIGSVVVEELVREGAQVVVVDNGLSGTAPSTDPRVHTVIADVRDPLCLDEVIVGVDGVIHLAGIVGDRACDMDHAFTWDTNYLATVYVANACKRAGVRRMVFASTCSNYGWSCGQAADVLSPLRPLSVYAESKVRAEHHLLAARDDEFSPCILRLATIFGVSPRMRFDLVVNVMTAHAVTRGQVLVHGGDQWRPFIHVRDAAGMMISALTAEPRNHAEIYNCGSDRENYRLLDLGLLVAAEVGGVEVLVNPTLDDERDYRVSFDAVSDALGYECGRSVADGVHEVRDALKSGLYPDTTAEIYDDYQLTRRYLGARDIPAPRHARAMSVR
jgi:nucleoside-diphosphate-sugar epimerase